MKTSKLVSMFTACAICLTMGIGSSAFCQKRAETEKTRITSPREIRALSPQPEPPDKDIKKSEKDIKTGRQLGINQGTPQPDPPNSEKKSNKK